MSKLALRHRVVRAVLVLGLLIVGAGLAGQVIRHQVTHRPITQATYYCPVHPSYTSDRPGDCPICNMKLVKREETTPTMVPTRDGHEHASEQLKTICYLHNCPKLHQGQPCPMTVVAKPGEAVTCPICGTHVAEAASPKSKRLLYWTDPMIPGYTSDKPGKSPMGMDLVPVYAEDTGADATGVQAPEGYAPVLLAPQRQQLIGVKTARAERRPMTKTIRTVGRIAYDPELYRAQEEYLQARRAAEPAAEGANPEIAAQSQRLAESSRIRLRLLGLSDTLIDEMAGWSGPDRSLLFADPDRRVWLYATIYEYELPIVAVGQTVRAEIPAVAGRTLEGTIRSIDPVLDPQTRSARVRAMLDDSDGLLKPEMFVNASIVVPLGEVLSVPEEAVFNTGAKRIVFVEKGQGLFEPRDVILGVQADGYAEVKSGIAEGEPVVTSGNFLIDSESRLKGALQGLGGEGHQHGQ